MSLPDFSSYALTPLTADNSDNEAGDDVTPTRSPYRSGRRGPQRGHRRSQTPPTPTKAGGAVVDTDLLISKFRVLRHGPASFGAYDPDSCRTLLDALHVQLPISPIYLFPQRQFLSGTKTPTQTEVNVNIAEQLESIVYAEDMLTPLLDQARDLLSRHKLDWRQKSRETHAFVNAIHPYHTVVGMPPVIHSEKDQEDWFLGMLLRPALLARLEYKGPATIRWNGQHTTPDVCGPYVSSSAGKEGVIPDALIMDGVEILGVAEVKTDRVLLLTAQELLFFHALQRHHIVEEKDKDSGEPSMRPLPGRAIRFVWPTPKKPIQDQQSKILVQVWSQMVAKGCEYAILSSYTHTIFFYKLEKTLYMSNVFSTGSDVRLAMFCWVSLMFGDLDANDLDLPECETSWWKNLEGYAQHKSTAGIIAEPASAQTSADTWARFEIHKKTYHEYVELLSQWESESFRRLTRNSRRASLYSAKFATPSWPAGDSSELLSLELHQVSLEAKRPVLTHAMPPSMNGSSYVCKRSNPTRPAYYEIRFLAPLSGEIGQTLSIPFFHLLVTSVNQGADPVSLPHQHSSPTSVRSPFSVINTWITWDRD
ncbi:hypothetical protein NM688_g1687 [Phlebia brevispora]|uniref:Uncharacterized protein n=1 Tax=Phlebia brevispora TaxID=194682 RepID=A0ACC1TB34_9APHY|nr:hypothetical protein NM688_g1687 [Phlebia brevispora]